MKTISVFWFVVWIIIAFAFAGALQQAYAFDYYQTMGTYFSGSPTTCIMLPDPEFESRTSAIHNATNSAIDEWQYKLQNATAGNWNIYRQVFDYEDHWDKTNYNYPQCQVFVNYIGETDSYLSQHGILGRASADVKNNYYWLEIQTQIIHRSISISIGTNWNTSDSGIKTEEKSIPITDIENIIKHEYGHALGLEHFYCTDDRDDCSDDSIMYPHLDIFQNNTKTITERDINMLIRMYGNDGFGFPHPDIPEYCLVLKDKTC